MNKLAGKVCVVTGAGGGIGQAIAVCLAQEGACVYGLDLAPSAARRFDSKGSIIPLECDIADPASLEPVFKKIGDERQRIDVLVNNAAMASKRGRITDIPLDQWNREIAVNLTGLFLVTRLAIPLMNRGASVISLASTWAHVGAPNLATYAATKGATLAISRTLALDYAKEGIRFNTISPGPILTERLVQAYGSAESATAALVDRVPLGRLGEPSEIGEAAVYLASDQSSFMTGSDLRIDGGYCAR